MSTTLVARGVFRPDGLIELLDPVEFPLQPQEVTVTVTERVASDETDPTRTARTEREPSGFWPDESISAPFDLPRSGTPHPIAVRRATKPRLPDPFFPEVEGSE